MEFALDFRPTTERPTARLEQDRLEQLVACFQTLVGHELPNSLVSIQGLARMAAQSDSLDEARPLLDRVVAHASKADRFSRRLIEITRLLRIPATGPLVELAEIVQEAAAEVNVRFAGRLAIESVGALPSLALSRPLLHAVLVELFRNAVEASVNASCRVNVFGRRVESGFDLTVRDDAKGMTSVECDALLEPFASSRQPGAENVGLGFFLVRQAVARWGGSLSVTTQSGQGTAVSLFLPSSETIQHD